MEHAIYNVTYKDMKTLSVELEFVIACKKVEGFELLKVSLENTNLTQRFRNSTSKLLKAMKRDGAIKLFVFEDELKSSESMEGIYILNKYPELSRLTELTDNSVYIKL